MKNIAIVGVFNLYQSLKNRGFFDKMLVEKKREQHG